MNPFKTKPYEPCSTSAQFVIRWKIHCSNVQVCRLNKMNGHERCTLRPNFSEESNNLWHVKGVKENVIYYLCECSSLAWKNYSPVLEKKCLLHKNRVPNLL
jgi:hypothetical protein